MYGISRFSSTNWYSLIFPKPRDHIVLVGFPNPAKCYAEIQHDYQAAVWSFFHASSFRLLRSKASVFPFPCVLRKIFWLGLILQFYIFSHRSLQLVWLAGWVPSAYSSVSSPMQQPHACSVLDAVANVCAAKIKRFARLREVDQLTDSTGLKTIMKE